MHFGLFQRHSFSEHDNHDNIGINLKHDLFFFFFSFFFVAETRTPVEVSGLSRGGSCLLHRRFRIWLQTELSRCRRATVSRANDNSSPLGAPAVPKGEMHQLRQILPIEAQLQLQRDRGSEL